MTKIGEGNEPIKPLTTDAYKKELDLSSQKFLHALDQYQAGQAKTPEEQRHLRDLMDQQMGIIQSAIKELNKKGFHKEATKIAKDYTEFRQEETKENYTCLRNDVETLREHNKAS
ncbi:MAG: hypothetical protein FJZ64_04800 [Chlamydiae bacterium]|nr:hypothetical protein [Chlamydiota bacterium]